MLAEKEARHLRWFQQEREKRIEQRGTYLCNILDVLRGLPIKLIQTNWVYEKITHLGILQSHNL